MITRTINSFVATLTNVRAVSSAKIILDGLTVLSGKNGSGKTTISRSIQDLVEGSLYLKCFLRGSVLNKLYRNIQMPLNLVFRAIGIEVDKEEYLKNIGKAAIELSFEDVNAHIDGLENLVKNVFSSSNWTAHIGDVLEEDILDHLHLYGVGVKTFDDFAAWVIKEIANARSSLEAYEKAKPTRALFEEADLNSKYLWKGELVLEENGERCIAYNNADMEYKNSFSTLSKVVYIESPLISDLQFRQDGYLSIENNLLRIREKPSMATNDDDLIRDFITKVLEGEVKISSAVTGRKYWSYEKKIGDVTESYDLEDCATGIKGLSIIANLYNLGCLDDKTLLIIDEPEAHLHPEWVVAYARIIVLLVKNLGLRILLASHSPDMINALKIFSSSSNCSKMTHFYKAVPAKDNEGKYDFIDKELSISDIFDSFNKVYDIIDKYANIFRSEA